ncbi:hypothetical protein D3C75_937030 [compost metagenome]
MAEAVSDLMAKRYPVTPNQSREGKAEAAKGKGIMRAMVNQQLCATRFKTLQKKFGFQSGRFL